MTLNKSSYALALLTAGFLSLAMTTAATAEPTVKHIESISKLPGPVLAAAEKSHPGGVIVHVYHDHNGPKYGRSEFYVNIVTGDQVYNVGLTATGAVLKDEVDNKTERIARLPDVVRAAARGAFPDAVIFGGGTRNNIFQVNLLSDGAAYDLEISKSGQVISSKRNQRQ